MEPVLVEEIRRLRGGSQAHVMRATDGNCYAVKFQKNPQGTRVLFNEYLAARIAEDIGLPVIHPKIIAISPQVAQCNPDLYFDFPHGRCNVPAGCHFGSRYIDTAVSRVYDWLPAAMLREEFVRNIAAFAGMLAFDKWTCNADSRQAIFVRTGHEKKYSAVFIDHGYCFNSTYWRFANSRLGGAYLQNEAYDSVVGWESFEPWITRIEEFSEQALIRYSSEIPPEWYDEDLALVHDLIARLYKRRRIVRELIDDFRTSDRQPFKNWEPAADNQCRGARETRVTIDESRLQVQFCGGAVCSGSST